MALTDKLTAIADAIREKQGKERYIYGEPPIIGYDEKTGMVTKTLTKKVGSSNINLETGEASTVYSNGLNEKKTVTFDEMPANTPVHITLWYGTESTSYDWVVVNNGSTSSTPQSYSDWTSRYGGNRANTKDTATKVEFDWSNDTNTFTFGLRSDGSSGQYYGYYAELSVEYEEEGVIQVPIYGEAPLIGDNSLTLAQMPDEIRTLSKINGELKTVTAKTAVSKGDMVQYSENNIKAAAPLDSYTLGQYFDPVNYPWGISWVSDEVGILWSTPNSSSDYNIYVYALKFEGDGLITPTLIATYSVVNKNESFLEWVLLDDGETAVGIGYITSSSNGYLQVTNGININKKNGAQTFPDGRRKQVGEVSSYGYAGNYKTKKVESDTEYKIYYAGNYISGGYGKQTCGCVYIDKTTGDCEFDKVGSNSASDFSSTTSTGNYTNSVGTILDIQEIDTENRRYCSFIGLQSSKGIKIITFQRDSANNNIYTTNWTQSTDTSYYGGLAFLPRKSITDPVMWVYIDIAKKSICFNYWDKDNKVPKKLQDSIVLDMEQTSSIYLKKISDSLFMVCGTMDATLPWLYLHWDIETYTMSLLNNETSWNWCGGFKYGEDSTQQSGAIDDVQPVYDLFPNIAVTSNRKVVINPDSVAPLIRISLPRERVKLDKSLTPTNLSLLTCYGNVNGNITINYYQNMRHTCGGDGQTYKLHTNKLAFEPLQVRYFHLYTIDNTPTIGNLLASDNPTGFAVAAEDIPAGGTGQAYVI